MRRSPKDYARDGRIAPVDPRTLRRTVLGFALAAVVFAVLLAVVDVGEVLAALARADLRFVALVALALVCWNLAWGVALWQVLAVQTDAIPFGRALLFHAAAALANHVTPLGQAGGEPVTAWIITRSSDTDYEVSLASVASFDAIHLAPSLSIGAVGALALLATGSDPGDDLLLLFAVVIAAAVVVPLLAAVAWRYRAAIARRVGPPVSRLLRRVLGALPGRATPDLAAVEDRLGGFARAIERVGTDRPRLVTAFAFSTVGWLLQATSLLFALLAVGASVPVPVALVAVPIGATAGGLPTPGGLGGTEAVYVATLTLVTSVDVVTVTAAVAIHATGGYLLTIALGAGAVTLLGTRVYP